MAKISGGCLCGATHYESEAEPAMVAVCHCTDCQKQSGSAFSVNVGVPTESLTLSGDSLATYEVTGTSGQPVTRRFCSRCGSPLTTEPAAFAGVAFIKAGTLDDSSWVKPSVQIWCDSAQAWGVLDDSMAKVAANPG